LFPVGELTFLPVAAAVVLNPILAQFSLVLLYCGLGLALRVIKICLRCALCVRCWEESRVHCYWGLGCVRDGDGWRECLCVNAEAISARLSAEWVRWSEFGSLHCSPVVACLVASEVRVH